MMDPEQVLEKEPKMIIQIIAAHCVRNADWLPMCAGKSDCYCVTRAGNLSFTTSVVNDRVDPVWNELVEVNYTASEPLEFFVFAAAAVGNLPLPEESQGTLEDPLRMPLVPPELPIRPDCLGKAALESGEFADGFNGELPLETGNGSRAFLRVKIKVPGKDTPPGPPQSFNFTVNKGKNPSWGLIFDPGDCKTLHVADVSHGPFNDYNLNVQHEFAIVPTDYIVSVNAIKGMRMVEELAMASTVSVEVRREVVVTIILEKGDGDAPLGALFPRKLLTNALLITNITGGVLGDHNGKTKDENMKIQAGDRIIAVGGFRGHAKELKKKLEESTGHLKLMISRPAPDAINGGVFFGGHRRSCGRMGHACN